MNNKHGDKQMTKKQILEQLREAIHDKYKQVEMERNALFDPMGQDYEYNQCLLSQKAAYGHCIEEIDCSIFNLGR